MPKKIRELYHYSMLIQWSDEAEAYVVTLPEFPTCHTHGATYEEAARNGEEVLRLVIEDYQKRGAPLPRPAQFAQMA